MCEGKKRERLQNLEALFSMVEIVPSNGEISLVCPKERKALIIVSTPEVVDELRETVKAIMEQFGEGEEHNDVVVSLDAHIDLNRVLGFDGN